MEPQKQGNHSKLNENATSTEPQWNLKSDLKNVKCNEMVWIQMKQQPQRNLKSDLKNLRCQEIVLYSNEIATSTELQIRSQDV